MKYFLVLVDEGGNMVAEMIRKFVDAEIMPIRHQIDDDTEHKLINQILVKMSQLGVFNVELREEEGAGQGFPLTTACAVIEEIVSQNQRVYGINTGFGKLSNETIPREKLSLLQENLLKSHAVGVGDAAGP